MTKSKLLKLLKIVTVVVPTVLIHVLVFAWLSTQVRIVSVNWTGLKIVTVIAVFFTSWLCLRKIRQLRG